MAVRGRLRLSDRAMRPEDGRALLARAPVMRLGTFDRDGWPYVIPLSFVWEDGKAYFHHTREDSHLGACLDRDPRVCIEVDEVGPVFAKGDTGCALSRDYRSVIGFGTVRQVTDPGAKERAFKRFLEKYAPAGSGLPTSYPNVDKVLVFEVAVETVTGKQVRAS